MDEANRNIFSGCRGHQGLCGAVLQGDLGVEGKRTLTLLEAKLEAASVVLLQGL